MKKMSRRPSNSMEKSLKLTKTWSMPSGSEIKMYWKHPGCSTNHLRRHHYLQLIANAKAVADINKRSSKFLLSNLPDDPVDYLNNMKNQITKKFLTQGLKRSNTIIGGLCLRHAWPIQLRGEFSDLDPG